MIIARCKDPSLLAWAQSFFLKLYKWTMAKFPLKNHIVQQKDNEFITSMWLVGGDRKVTFQKDYSFGTAGLKSRKENYHHPRCLLMMSQLAEEAIVSIGANLCLYFYICLDVF